MSILIDKNTRVLVQGITGKSGSLQTKAMLDAGTQIVAGVTPGKGGQEVFGIPVYNYVAEAKRAHDFEAVIYEEHTTKEYMGIESVGILWEFVKNIISQL